MDAATYQQEFTKYVAQGYMPTDLNVAALGNEVRYCVIFDKIPNPPAWVAKHNLTQAAFNQEQATWTGKGYKLRLTSSCATPGGSVWAALWQK